MMGSPAGFKAIKEWEEVTIGQPLNYVHVPEPNSADSFVAPKNKLFQPPKKHPSGTIETEASSPVKN